MLLKEMGIKEEKVYEYCSDCGKRCYTLVEANVTLNHIKSRHNQRIKNGKRPRRKYLCEICGMYHLTSMQKTGLDRMKVKYKRSKNDLRVQV